MLTKFYRFLTTKCALAIKDTKLGSQMQIEANLSLHGNNLLILVPQGKICKRTFNQFVNLPKKVREPTFVDVLHN